MSRDWKIRVQPAQRTPFAFRTTFLAHASDSAEGALEEQFLYGEGDLAVLLEDLGAGVVDICRLLDALRAATTAEILIDVSDEAMEVLARRPSPRA